MILLGVRHGDSVEDAATLARKTASLRIFPDDTDRMRHDLRDVQGQALVISQFTLYASTRKGNRPGFGNAADPEPAEACYDHYVDRLRQELGPDRCRHRPLRSHDVGNDRERRARHDRTHDRPRLKVDSSGRPRVR